MVLIGINYIEYEIDSYSSVYVESNTKTTHDKIFDSGDIVVDFKNAVEYAISLGEHIYYSSTVDNFIIDSGYAYLYSDEDLLIPAEQRIDEVMNGKETDKEEFEGLEHLLKGNNDE